MKVLFIIVVFALLYTFPTYVHAQDATPSGDIQQKIDQLKAEIASKAAQFKQQVDQKLQNKLVSGLIQSVNDTQLVVAGNDKNTTVLTNQYTDYQYQGRISKKIAKDDFIVALGDINDQGALVARRIVKTTQPSNNPLSVFWGRVTEASTSGFIVTTAGKTQSVSIDKNTNITLGTKNGSSSDLLVNRPVIVSGYQQAGIISARFIYIYPNFKPKLSVATSSASLSGTKK